MKKITICSLNHSNSFVDGLFTILPSFSKSSSRSTTMIILRSQWKGLTLIHERFHKLISKQTLSTTTLSHSVIQISKYNFLFSSYFTVLAPAIE